MRNQILENLADGIIILRYTVVLQKCSRTFKQI
jgi:hypothetical protein